MGQTDIARRDQAKGWRASQTLTMAAGLMCALAVGSCGRDPFEPTLTFALPQNYQTAAPLGAAPVSTWWRNFGSLELNALMERANIDNLDIAIAVSQFEEAEAQAGITGAALFPTLGYSENNSRSQTSGTTAPERISKPGQSSSFNKVINASYVVDVWGQNRDSWRAALGTAAASAFQIEVIRLTTRAAVVNNFLVCVTDRERVRVATQNLNNALRILELIRQRREPGIATASELDFVQQQSLVEIQRASIPPVRQAGEAARIALALLIGQPAQAVQLSSSRVRGLKVPSVTPGLPSSLLVRRPDVRNAEEQLMAADATVSVARKAFLPTVALTGQTGFQSALVPTLLRPESFVYSVAAGMTQPIFEGGKLRAQLALNVAQRQQLLSAYRKTIVSALTDVENALIAIQETAARERAQRSAVMAARRAFELSEERLRQGTIDLTNLLNVQNTLFQAEDTLIQVRLARLQAIVSLYQAIGGDWEGAGADTIAVH